MSKSETTEGFPLSAPLEAGTYSTAPTVSFSGAEDGAKITVGQSQTTDLQRVVDWRKSHPDTIRWRAYYAAFELKYGRESDEHEFDSSLSQIVDRVMSVVRMETQKVLT